MTHRVPTWSGGISDLEQKIINDRTQLAEYCDKLRQSGNSIVFTNGCYDVFHIGHLRTLQFSKEQGDILIVGLNSDSSVSRLKGPNRPIFHLSHRAELVAAFNCVDVVTAFSEDTPEDLIRTIASDVLVKGMDWKGKKIAGEDFVKSVVFCELVPGASSSKILEAVGKS